MTKTELTNEDKGLWNVQTETSSYLVDMDNKKAMRSPNTGAGIHPDHAENRVVFVNPIRGDGEWFPMSEIEQCKVGEPMYMYQPGAGMRSTTIVRKIIRVYQSD